MRKLVYNVKVKGDIYMHIGERIKLRRKELGISVDDLASILGKDRSTIYRYEKGDIESLPLDILNPIAKALRTTPASLMGWEESNTPAVPSSPSSIDNEFLQILSTLSEEDKQWLLDLIKTVIERRK